MLIRESLKVSNTVTETDIHHFFNTVFPLEASVLQIHAHAFEMYVPEQQF